MSKRVLASLLLVSALSLPAAAGDCPPPTEPAPLSWSDWFANWVIELITGPATGPGYSYECTDVDIFFEAIEE